MCLNRRVGSNPTFPTSSTQLFRLSSGSGRNSGYSRRMTPEKADALGIDGFLMKPLKLSSLSETVREILDGR